MSTRPRSTFHRERAVDVVGVDALRSEPRDDDAAVGGGRGAGVGGLDVPLVERLAFVRDALPHDLAGALVDRVDHPALARAIVRRVAVAVEPGLERRVRPAADRARHEDADRPRRSGSNARGRESACARGCSRRSCRPSGRAAAGRSATPDACGPRNDGQLPAAVAGSRAAARDRRPLRSIRRTGTARASPAGRQCCDRGSSAAARSRRRRDRNVTRRLVVVESGSGRARRSRPAPPGDE